jgi:hypothetical protein
MTNSLLFSRLFSMAARRCRFRKHQATTAVPTAEGTPTATPIPIATGLLMPDPPPSESAGAGCYKKTGHVNTHSPNFAASFGGVGGDKKSLPEQPSPPDLTHFPGSIC